jgi:hypothetical protein
LNSIFLWISGLKDDVLSQLKLRENEERYVQYKKNQKEYHRKSAELFKKSSDILGRLKNKFYQAEMLGRAAKEYYRVFELSDEEELKIDVVPGVAYALGDTQVGNIISLYHSAAVLFNDLGVEFEEAGKISQAYVFYGFVGDAYLSAAFMHEKNKFWLFPTLSDQADNYLYAAEAYKKSGKSSRNIGVPKIVFHARLEWEYAMREIYEFFKDENGYGTSDDLKRAILAFKKAGELYGKIGAKSNAEYCSRMIKEIEEYINMFNMGKPSHLIPRDTSATGYPWADQEHSTIMLKITQYILPEDWENYDNVLASLLNYMGQNLDDPSFKGQDYDETAFHKDLSRHLKRSPSIGVKALNEVYIGAGRVDILVKGIPVELKVEKTLTNTREIIEKHKSQASYYASSQGKQVGILCILDLTKKESSIPPPQNDVDIVGVPVHGFEEGKIVHPALIVALIIRGNLPPPSSLN